MCESCDQQMTRSFFDGMRRVPQENDPLRRAIQLRVIFFLDLKEYLKAHKFAYMHGMTLDEIIVEFTKSQG